MGPPGHVGPATWGEGLCTLQKVHFGPAVTRRPRGRVRLCVDRHARALWVQILGGRPLEGAYGSRPARSGQEGACVMPPRPVGPATRGQGVCTLERVRPGARRWPREADRVADATRCIFWAPPSPEGSGGAAKPSTRRSGPGPRRRAVGAAGADEALPQEPARRPPEGRRRGPAGRRRGRRRPAGQPRAPHDVYVAKCVARMTRGAHRAREDDMMDSRERRADLSLKLRCRLGTAHALGGQVRRKPGRAANGRSTFSM